MLRTLARWTGYATLALAMTLGVIDGTRSISVSGLDVTPLGAAALWLFPKQFPLIAPAVSRNLHPFVWDPVLVSAFLVPAAIVFFAVGALLVFLGRQPAEAAITAR
jgi:hypothetical protein